MDFKSVIGQETVKRVLIQTADHKQLPNSFLFYGPEGVGKWAMALALTAYLNCRHVRDGDSCGNCPPCRQINKLQYPNLYIAIPTPPSKSEKEENENYWEILNQKINEPYSLIEGRRQMSIPVATVREMKRNLTQRPPTSGMRVVIIEQMERMLVSSADALLKLVEEPPSQTLIIITSSHPEKVPSTIVSRCRRLRFSYLPEQTVCNYLTEKKGISSQKATLFARLSHGSLGRAIYLAEDENSEDREVAKLIFKGIFQTEAASLIAEASDLLPFNDRFRLNRIILWWQYLFRDLILLQSGADRNTLINADFAAELERLAAHRMNQRNMVTIPDLLGTVTEDINLNVETRTAVSALLNNVQKKLELVFSPISSANP